METPEKVSIILPTYNGAKYLRQSIDSCLNQTYRNIELIIVDDGSMDETSQIIKSYPDERIKYIRHDKNKGLPHALNTGFAMATGEYLTWTSDDNYYAEDAVESMVALLQINKTIDFVYANYYAINDNGAVLHSVSVGPSKSLKEYNCIGPCFLYRRKVYEVLGGYDPDVFLVEDYEYWIRIFKRFEMQKLEKSIYWYRLHSRSLTGQHTDEAKHRADWIRNRYFKIHAIWFFIKRSMYFIQLKVKNILIRLGKIIGFFIRLDNRSSIFFFLPYYHIGGAEKVHARIVASVQDRLPWVFFTNKSKDEKFRILFSDKARLFDLSPFTSNRFSNLILLGVLVAVVNRHPRAVVFGCNNAFFYRMIPYLKPSIRRIDLLHAFGGGIEDISIPVVSDIDTRVVVNHKTLYDLKEQYASLGFDGGIRERVLLIENAVLVPDSYCEKGRNPLLRILYVGRGSKEKRAYLIGKAATKCNELRIPAEFILVGDIFEAVEIHHQKHCIFEGEIADPEELNRLYDWADLLVLTSSREGFPMVIMEAMAHGVVPVSTNVGGIPFHIKHGFNGMLVPSKNEDEIVDSVVEFIAKFAKDRLLLTELSSNAYDYARSHFKLSRFYASYRKLILGESI